MPPFFTTLLKKIQPHWRVILGGAIIFGAIVISSSIVVSRTAILPYAEYMIEDITMLPDRDIALVFGGGMEDDGTQSKMQEMRVKTAVELYKKGKVKKIMMTGDDGRVRFDEITAMVYYARTNGVPVYDIMTDPHGYRTYESCYREKRVYNIQHAVAISQEFHLPRILYFCRSFGIDIIGFPADYQGYELDTRMAVRETLARVKGWWQIRVTQPYPRVRI